MGDGEDAALIDYVREIRAALPAEVFAPARSRIAWLPVHLAIIVAAMLTIASGVGGWPVALACSLVLGMSFAGLSFLGHEVLHGAVLRGRTAIQVVGWICFSPFLLSPRLWIAWHNRAHHGNTMAKGVDPDAYPTLEAYRQSFALRLVTSVFSLGRRSPLGFTSLLIGFTVQSAHMLFAARSAVGMSPARHRVALAQSGLAAAMWITLAFVLGPLGFVFAYVIPLLIANVMVMSYILTNHSLSPLTDENDPLLNSLSVTTPRWYSFLTLDFGMHVEHHLLPAMSTRHAGRVREVLQARWPERYQSMPLGRAVWQLMRTARVYRDDTTLHDPWTGRDWPAILPRPIATASAAANAAAPSTLSAS
ncbi:MAG: fatty acid desaturase [Deltaproteobacteria bacterium]|nr:fatty acid desaturase [Nannocystaceae bacterium]